MTDRPDSFDRSRPADQAGLIWGRRPVVEALRAGREIKRLFVAEGARPNGPLGEILAKAAALGIHPTFVDRHALDRMASGANHQGMIAEVGAFRYADFNEIVARAAGGSALPLLLLLDSLQDPQNLGTLIRTADAVGVNGVVLPLHRSVDVTPAVEKASAGAVEYVPIAQVTNLGRAASELKREGYWIVGLTEKGTMAYNAFPVDAPLAVVVGAEGRGIGRLLLEACDFRVHLPMHGQIQSLNAAVAGSVLLYEVLRRRGV